MLLSEIEKRCLGTFSTRRTSFMPLLEYVAGQDLSAARQYYEDYFKDVPVPPELPLVSDAQDFKSVEVAHVGLLSAASTSARRLNISLHILAQAAFAVALGEHFGVTDLVSLAQLRPFQSLMLRNVGYGDCAFWTHGTCGRCGNHARWVTYVSIILIVINQLDSSVHHYRPCSRTSRIKRRSHCSETATR
jgi:hypothetical protein